MIVVAHPTGSANARMAAAEFERLGLLDSFHVGLNIDLAHPLIQHLPENVLRHLRRRSYDLPQAKMRSFPMVEGTMLALENLPASPARALGRIYRARMMERYFDWRMSQALHGTKAPVFYGFGGSCLQSARTARKLGKLVVTEVTAVVDTEHRVLREEAALNPEWASTQILPSDEISKKQVNYQNEVFEVSNVIVSPSAISASYIPDKFQNKVEIQGYHSDTFAKFAECSHRGRPLKILFVGALCQRKGLQYLSEALDCTQAGWTLTLVGCDSPTPSKELDALKARSQWFPTLPNFEVRQLMHAHDVLVLPSLSETFGLVVTEALSQGTPVIVSENTGAKDRVIDGENGFVVPVRDAGAIAARLALLQNDRKLLARMSERALAIAREEEGLPYLGKVIDRLHDLLGQQRPGRFDRLASPELAT